MRMHASRSLPTEPKQVVSNLFKEKDGNSDNSGIYIINIQSLLL